MENLLDLLENNFEQVSLGVYAEWLNDDQKEPKSVKGMLNQMSWLDDECKNLLKDERVKLVLDYRALIVNVL